MNIEHKFSPPQSALLSQFDFPFAPSKRCANCSAVGIQRFYRIEGIPTHSFLLLPDRQSAVNYPTGNLDVACCPTCGFITNLDFDPSLNEYSANYEETQGYSPTFAAFADRLAGRLTDDYGLTGKSVLEIGCGKGEFLAKMVEHGVARGIGLDPAYVPGRLSPESLAKLEFRREMYDENTPDIVADFICCRHTLEHIPNTLEFMRTVRRKLGDRHDVHLFIEVPDVTRILAEAAFWDMFYEHCSYFSEASLEQVFRIAGFEVVESWLDFDDQYLMMVGRPSNDVTPDKSQTAGKATLAGTLTFKSAVASILQRWRDLVESRSRQGQRIAIWGSGSKCVGFLTGIGTPTTKEVGCVVDINPHRNGRFMPGIPQEIIAPARLTDYKPDVVIIMNPIYRAEITADLHSMGLDPEVMAI